VTLAVIDAKQMADLWVVGAIVVAAVLAKLAGVVNTVVAVGRGAVAMEEIGRFVAFARGTVVAHVPAAFLRFVFTVRAAVAVGASAVHCGGRGIPPVGMGNQLAKSTRSALAWQIASIAPGAAAAVCAPLPERSRVTVAGDEQLVLFGRSRRGRVNGGGAGGHRRRGGDDFFAPVAGKAAGT
jgi:hypothetical protein